MSNLNVLTTRTLDERRIKHGAKLLATVIIEWRVETNDLKVTIFTEQGADYKLTPKGSDALDMFYHPGYHWPQLVSED